MKKQGERLLEGKQSLVEDTDSEKVKNKIEKTLKTLATIYAGTEYKKSGKKNDWSDGDNSSGLINSCEALEIFLIPCLQIEELREKFLSGRLLPLEIFRKTLEELLNQDFLFGDPYIDFSRKGDAGPPGSGYEKNLEFVDAAGFMLSTMMDVKHILEFKPDLISKSESPKIEKQILKALNILKDAHVGPDRGWSYTDSQDETEKLDFLYFTWSAVEGLETILSEDERFLSVEAKTMLKEIRSLFYYSRNWIENTFLGGYPGGDYLNLQENLIDFGGGDTSLYYNLYAIVILHLTRSKKIKEIEKGLNMILDLMADKKIKRNVTDPEGFRFILEGSLFETHNKRYYDRCFIPLLLKALVLQARDNTDSLYNLLPKIREWEIELYNNQNSQILDVWDNTFRGYSIFYTQRAIEALTHLWALYKEIEKPPSLPSKEVILSQFIALISDEITSEFQKRFEEINNRVESHDSKLKELEDIIGERLLSNNSFIHELAQKLHESEPFKQFYSEIVETKETESGRLLDNEIFIQGLAAKLKEIEPFKQILKAIVVMEEMDREKSGVKK